MVTKHGQQTMLNFNWNYNRYYFTRQRDGINNNCYFLSMQNSQISRPSWHFTINRIQIILILVLLHLIGIRFYIQTVFITFLGFLSTLQCGQTIYIYIRKKYFYPIPSNIIELLLWGYTISSAIISFNHPRVVE